MLYASTQQEAADLFAQMQASLATSTHAQPRPKFIDAGQEWWVVIAGAVTGVMTEDQCIEAVCGFDAPDMRGPFLSKEHALKVWRARSMGSAPVELPAQPSSAFHVAVFDGYLVLSLIHI